MTENVCNLLDNLTKHNSRAFGYELSRSEILQILKLFDDVKELEQYRAIGAIEEFKALKEKSVLKLAIFDKRCNKHVCPSCNALIEKLGHCRICGQRVAHEALPGETVETIGYADQSGLMSAT